jgi:DNA-binding MarR family transcriptional regulator
MARTVSDSVDSHVQRWLPALPGLDPEVEGVITRMQRLLWLLRRQTAQAWAEQGVTDADVKTVQTLVSFEMSSIEATPAVLAEKCQVTRAGMTSRLDRLEKAGYVTRTADPADRRRVIVEATPAGRAMWEAASAVGIRLETDLLDHLSASQRHQLNSLLRVMLARVEAGSA